MDILNPNQSPAHPSFEDFTTTHLGVLTPPGGPVSDDRMDAPSEGLQQQVCIACKQRKRKCDKRTPSCSQCLKINRTCRYADVSRSSRVLEIRRLRRRLEALENSLGDEHSSEQSPSSNLGTDFSMASTGNGGVIGPIPPANVLLSDDNFVSPFFSRTDPFRYSQLRHAFVNVTITREVAKLVGSPSEFRRVANVFFETVHSWMPILSRSKFLADVKDVWSEPRADIALLALCMYLITQMPDESSSDSMRTSLYAKTKSFYALAESAGIVSISIVQCGILISLYELGHGLQPTAYISMGAHARTAMAFGIKETGRGGEEGQRDFETWRRVEEERRVRWGIVILDRYISLQNRGRSFTAIDPDLDHHLPVDDGAWDADDWLSPPPHTLSTALSATSLTSPLSPSIPVGPFARAAQMSHLLGRVIRHIFDPVSDPSFNTSEADQLNRTVLAFDRLLASETSHKEGSGAAADCKKFIGTVGMCNSAILLLHASPLFNTLGICDGQSGLRDASVRLAAGKVVEVAAMWPGKLGSVPVEAWSPLVVNSLFQAAIVMREVVRVREEELGDEGDGAGQERKGLESVLGMLRGFERRWKGAGVYFRRYEESGLGVGSGMGEFSCL